MGIRDKTLSDILSINGKPCNDSTDHFACESGVERVVLATGYPAEALTNYKGSLISKVVNKSFDTGCVFIDVHVVHHSDFL
jgi:hypothetical protein